MNGQNKAKEFVDSAISEGEINAEIGRLATLSPTLYEIMRMSCAARLKMRPTILDRLVRVRRKKEDKKDVDPLLPRWTVKPWPEPVDGDALLRDLIARLRRHIVYDDALTTTLWLTFSWVHDVAIHSPILLISSAEPECGKSSLLGLLSYLAPRAISSVDISKAALYRSIQLWNPSFFIDEFDDVLSGAATDESKAEMKSVINSGYTRGTGVIRCITDEHKPEMFSTFCPKCVGMIGRKLPPATLSRCITIPLRRRARRESIEEFAFQDDAELADLRSRLCRWAKDSADELRGMDVAMPEHFYNRRANNWRLLFAAADLCSGVEDWGARARRAAVKLEEGAAEVRRTAGAQALIDTRSIFDEVEGQESVGSADLVAKLAACPDSPWAEWKHGKPITQGQMARLLKPFGIVPQRIRLPGVATQRYL